MKSKWGYGEVYWVLQYKWEEMNLTAIHYHKLTNIYLTDNCRTYTQVQIAKLLYRKETAFKTVVESLKHVIDILLSKFKSNNWFNLFIKLNTLKSLSRFEE